MSESRLVLECGVCEKISVLATKDLRVQIVVGRVEVVITCSCGSPLVLEKQRVGVRDGGYG